MRHFLLCLFVCCSSLSYSQSIFEFDYYFDVDGVRGALLCLYASK
jgi:hypothetical protein